MASLDHFRSNFIVIILAPPFAVIRNDTSYFSFRMTTKSVITYVLPLHQVPVFKSRHSLECPLQQMFHRCVIRMIKTHFRIFSTVFGRLWFFELFSVIFGRLGNFRSS